MYKYQPFQVYPFEVYDGDGSSHTLLCKNLLTEEFHLVTDEKFSMRVGDCFLGGSDPEANFSMRIPFESLFLAEDTVIEQRPGEVLMESGSLAITTLLSATTLDGAVSLFPIVSQSGWWLYYQTNGLVFLIGKVESESFYHQNIPVKPLPNSSLNFEQLCDEVQRIFQPKPQ
jgi:hypothetical protein